MLVINKLAVQELPLPTVVSGAQLVVSAAVVLVLKRDLALRHGPDGQDQDRPVHGVHGDVRGRPVFQHEGADAHQRRRGDRRAVVLPRHRVHHRVGVHGQVYPARDPRSPSPGVVGFAGLYISNDAGVTVDGAWGYVWLFIWWMLLALQMTYGKWMTEKIEMTQWERVFYTNAFAIPPTICCSSPRARTARWRDGVGDNARFWLVASCAMGVGISYSGWKTEASSPPPRSRSWAC